MTRAFIIQDAQLLQIQRASHSQTALMTPKRPFFVQGHSRSPILVPIDRRYATYYWWTILTYILSRTISEL